MPRGKPDPALAFFAPRDASEVAAALAWADEHAQADAATRWQAWDGDRTAWTTLRLPTPRIHPRAPTLFAAAAGVAPGAIAAVLDRTAYCDDDGELRLWPWYPEEDEVERPRAARRAGELGIALPAELLDEPYEPAHYLARAGIAALEAWLARRGVDGSVARIDRVPVPPRAGHPDERFEGGMTARARVVQASGALISAVGLAAYVDDASGREQVERRIDAALARLCDSLGQPIAMPPPASEAAMIEAPSFYELGKVGHVQAVLALPRGPLLICDHALVELDRAGAFVMAWPKPIGDLFARNDCVVINYNAVLDLSAGRFLDAGGELAPIVKRMGLDTLPGMGGLERTAPVISPCGRYMLDVDESPHIVRGADGVVVAEGRALDKVLEPPTGKANGGLVSPDQVDLATPTVIDGVRFMMRGAAPPVRDGRSLAFALAGGSWRFLVGDAIRQGGKTVARIGISVHDGAFRDDASELWVLSSDHLIRIALDGPPRAAEPVPLEPILRAAVQVVARFEAPADA